MSTASKVERTAIHLPTQPILGDPSCTTNPTDCCDGGESIAGVVLTVEKRRWTLPAGAWIGETWCEDFETCCDASGSASTGPIQTACCDYPLNTTLTCLATIGGVTTIYNANWNGSYWVVDHPSMYALRCNGTTWEVGYNSGGSMVWTAASGRCTPDFFWGITVGGDTISFVGSAGDESMPGGATYRLRVQKTRVYLPATATVGSPRCETDPDDCCDTDLPPGTVTCCPNAMPNSLHLSLFDSTCSDLEISVPMYWDSALNLWRTQNTNWPQTSPGMVVYKVSPTANNTYCVIGAYMGCGVGGAGVGEWGLVLYKGIVITDGTGAYQSSQLCFQFFATPLTCSRPLSIDFGSITFDSSPSCDNTNVGCCGPAFTANCLITE